MIKVLLEINYLNFDLERLRTIFYDKDGYIYALSDLRDNIDKVSKMPSYLRDDLYKYNGTRLNLSTFNLLMKIYKSPGYSGPDKKDQDILLQIKRDIQLNDII